MAKPQIENGFAMIACELLAAIFIADFTKYEKAVLAEVLMSIYGPQKQQAAFIDTPRIASTIGVDPRIIHRAVKSLARKNVIASHANLTTTFNKDWESWRIDDDPKFSADPLNRLIRTGEAAFVRFASVRFSSVIGSTRKRKTGTKQSPSYESHQEDTGTNESPAPTTKGTIESPAPTTKGTAWSPPTVDESYKKLAASPDAATTPDPALAGACAPPSEELRLEIRREERIPPLGPLGGSGGGGADPALESQLDDLSRQIGTLMNDDELAVVFRDQVVDWMNGGMVVEDIREAVLIARGRGVLPQNFVPFISSTARRVRNDRLSGRRTPPAAQPVAAAVPEPGPAEATARFKAGLKAIREQGGRRYAR